ncbi:hypothetical protein UG46_00355 [Pseudomonas fluorescens]|uniref:aldose 1-epimerase n=1 Tax=Pseudomonas TaxID=286 RepID=UPI0005E1E6A2|nr:MULTISPECIES: aldose 1-epimerase [Pseudomonas]KJH88489.1 hypothetical protein UG46_00355 [Pseudomonas fluorescens]TFF51158.1 aldose 1-epimerase [Pseudomonas putida]TFF53700.1 aldose 1-epimerase [Pseudomonas putida]
MHTVVLSNATWSLSVLPDWGGRIAHLTADGLDILLPITTNQFDPLDWPRAGAYPLMPYSNRIRNAHLQFAGNEHQLPAHPAAIPHTLHGVTHTQPWQVVTAEKDLLVITCDYQGEHWPWAFRAEQHFVLEGNRLRIALVLTNLGDTPMPGGLGLHPYFKRHPGMRAHYRVGREWQIDAQYLATGEYQDHSNAWSIEADSRDALAHYQSRWDGLLELEYPNARLELQASQPLSHFVAFAPADSAYLCLEPVSHLADAFNQPRDSWAETGTHELAPCQRMEATLDFTWQHR